MITSIFNRCFLMISLMLLLSSCTHQQIIPEYKDIARYQFSVSSTLESRLAPTPPFLLDALQQMDKRSDYHDYKLSTTETDELRRVIALLPERQRAVMKKRLLGIYFVRNFSSGGYSDYLTAPDGTIYLILVLNPDILKTSISKWVTYKEMSAFSDDGSGVYLNAECHDNGHTALTYIMLHESAHLLDYAAGCTPFVEKELAHLGKPLKITPFSAAAWREYNLPLPAYNFDDRNQLVFYGVPGTEKLKRNDIPALYRRLALTPFPILYASQNWAEDFADTVAFYELAGITGKACTIITSDTAGKTFNASTLERSGVTGRIPFIYSACRWN